MAEVNSTYYMVNVILKVSFLHKNKHRDVYSSFINSSFICDCLNLEKNQDAFGKWTDK